MPSIENNLTVTSEYDLPFLTEHPVDILKEGRFNNVPVLMGFNAHEAMLFIRRKLKSSLTKFQLFEDKFELN